MRDPSGAHSFRDLSETAGGRARSLTNRCEDLSGERVAYLMAPGFEQVATQWAIWLAGGVAVPLAISHPVPELAHVLVDARPAVLVIDDDLRTRADEAVRTAAALATADGGAFAGETDDRSARGPFDVDAIAVLTTTELDQVYALRPRSASENATGPRATTGTGRASSSEVAAELEAGVGRPDAPALIVYTSGTTARAKGAVSSHANLEAQIRTLVDAWEWTPDDRILHVLPLHHVHGIVNALCCPLWAGACCEFGAPEPAQVWERLASGEITVFMGVPTLYRRLIGAWEAAPPTEQKRWSNGAAGLRLMVSGSAALPVETLARWEQITGHRLLERYGMTEIGMALGNPLHGERRAGTVGQPFPGVEARIVDDNGMEVGAGEPGQIEVRGAQVFREYWNRPAETRVAFGADGWFRTGDEGVIEDGYWRILGRRSVDIIKSGGYKVSALEIEAALRQHPAVADAAVIGMPDGEWGERVCAAVVPEAGQELDGEALRAWCKERLAPYKVPKQVAVMTHLPRNAMGKVTKPALRPAFAESTE